MPVANLKSTVPLSPAWQPTRLRAQSFSEKRKGKEDDGYVSPLQRELRHSSTKLGQVRARFGHIRGGEARARWQTRRMSLRQASA